MSDTPTTKLLTTYSLWSTFRNCRRAAYWRYVRELVPRIAIAKPLAFGQLIHSCLESWHLGSSLGDVLTIVDKAYPGHSSSPSTPAHAQWHLARAMMRGYSSRYPAPEDWRVIALEHQFDGQITNPATEATSRTFYMGGRVDGVVAMVAPEMGPTERVWILEHKTASTIDANYLDKLWTDFQTALYALYVENTLNLKVTGVIYNVLAKAKLQQHQGETEAEWEERRAELCAKNKSGKTTAVRAVGETDDEFAARLDAWYAAADKFHREQLILSRDQIGFIQCEVWELTQQWLDCRRRDVWYQNPSYCMTPGRSCPYWPICSSSDNPNVIDNLFEPKAAHEELEARGSAIPASFATTFEPGWSPEDLSF